AIHLLPRVRLSLPDAVQDPEDWLFVRVGVAQRGEQARCVAYEIGVLPNISMGVDLRPGRRRVAQLGGLLRLPLPGELKPRAHCSDHHRGRPLELWPKTRVVPSPFGVDEVNLEDGVC